MPSRVPPLITSTMRHVPSVLLPSLVMGALLMGNSDASAQSWYSGYQEMLNQVNQIRRVHSLAPLCNSAKLMASALSHSQYQAIKTSMTHVDDIELTRRFSNQGFPATSMAENVQLSGSLNVQEAMNAWMNDQQHASNILGPYTHFGSAAVQGKDGQYYWTQHFATSSDPQEPCINANTTNAPAYPSSTQPAYPEPINANNYNNAPSLSQPYQPVNVPNGLSHDAPSGPNLDTPPSSSFDQLLKNLVSQQKPAQGATLGAAASPPRWPPYYPYYYYGLPPTLQQNWYPPYYNGLNPPRPRVQCYGGICYRLPY